MPSGFSVMPTFTRTDQPPGTPTIETPRSAQAVCSCLATRVSIVFKVAKAIPSVLVKNASDGVADDLLINLHSEQANRPDNTT